MTLSDKISKGKAIHGIWRILPSTAITEIIAQSGFDFQILDCEHGVYDYGTLNNDILACEVHGCAPFVRVSGLNKVQVQRCLDIGAKGIVFPQLEHLDDFKKAVELMSYAPKGIRGFNPFVRNNRYGINTGSVLVKPMCVTIIETLSAVSDLDDILDIEGIDLIYIGSYDLSAQLGCIGQMNAPELLDTINLILDKCNNKNKLVSLMVNDKTQFESASKKGAKVFVHNVDSYKIKRVFSEYLNQF